MKKVLVILATISLAILLFACDTEYPASEPTPIPAVVVTPESTPTPTPEPTPEPVVEHNITINLNYEDAEELPPVVVEDGTTIYEIPIHEREGYLFSYWSLSADGGDEIQSMTFIADTTLYAQWERELSEKAIELIDEGYVLVGNNTNTWWANSPDWSCINYVWVSERGAGLIDDGFVFIPVSGDEYETDGIFVSMGMANGLISGGWYYRDNPDDRYCTLGVIVTDDLFLWYLARGYVLAFWDGETFADHRYQQGGVSPVRRGTPPSGFMTFVWNDMPEPFIFHTVAEQLGAD